MSDSDIEDLTPAAELSELSMAKFQAKEARHLLEEARHLLEKAGRSRMPSSIAKGLVTAQAAVVKVPHDGHNKHHDYHYTTAEAVIEAARKPMEIGGLALVQMVGQLTPPKRITWWETNTDGAVVEIADTLPASIEVRHLLTHSDGETWELPPMHVPVIPEKGRPWDKAIATASTYALGYCLRGVLKMPRTDEADDLDRRNDDKLQRATRAPAQGKSGEDAAAVAAKAIEEALGSLPTDEVPTLEAWCAAYASKANRAVGMERLRGLVAAAAQRLEVPEAAWQAFLAKAVAASKERR